MKLKLYSADKVAEVAKILADTPVLHPKFVPHSDTIAELSTHIRDMHFRKNYDARHITKILKENGIKATIKEIKNLLQNSTKVVKKNFVN